ncbi:MAG: hypothetical protein Q7T71_15255, partial [Herbiconiux sp.]|nr:hypothetical protein [Herbiconiux sp.]
GGGIAVGAFLVAAGGLATVAAIQAGAPPVSTTTPVVAATGTPTGGGTGDAVPLDTATRLITAFDAGTAWRSTVGSCPATDVVVERSTDGGGTWNGFNLGSSGGISSAIALQSYDNGDSAYLIGLDATACTPTWVGTTTAGSAWVAYPDRSATTWYPEPEIPAFVHTPASTASPTPCDVSGLAAVSGSSASVLCTDRTVYRTVDGGSTWLEAESTPGAEAIGRGQGGYLVASTSPEVTCAGFAVTFVPEAVDAPNSIVNSCVPTTSAGAEVALTGTADSLWLWSGTIVLRSLDGGATWS